MRTGVTVARYIDALDGFTGWLLLNSTAVAGLVAAVWFLPIVFSHAAGADSFLVHLGAIASFDQAGTASTYGKLAAYLQATGEGWFPLAPLPYAIWLLGLPLLFVKATQFVLVVATFATFAAVAKRLLGTSQYALIAVCCTLAAWQLRMPHDPVIGTSIVIPWLAELWLLSLLALLNAEKERRLEWTAISSLLLLLALLTSPLAWGLGALLVGVAMLRPQSRRAGLALSSVLVLTIAVSTLMGGAMSPLVRGGAYLANVAAQFFAAVPASYRALGYLPLYVHTPAIWTNTAIGLRQVDDRFIAVPQETILGALGAALVAMVAFMSLSRRSIEATTFQQRIALALGMGLWIVPSLLLGSSQEWRSGLPFGQAFAGVYFEYFGVGLVAALGLRALQESRGIGRLVPTLASLAILVCCYGNVRSDAASLNKAARADAGRISLERAASAGFFKALPSGSTVLLDPKGSLSVGVPDTISDAKYAIYDYSRRRYRVAPLTSSSKGVDDAWVLETQRPAQMEISLLHVRRGDSRLTDRALGFTTVPDAWKSAMLHANGMHASFTTLRDGVLVEVRRACGAVALKSAFLADRPTFVWLHGFYHSGPVGYAPTYSGDPLMEPMFMASSSSLEVRPSACHPQRIAVTFAATSAAAARLSVEVNGRTSTFVTPTNSPVRLNIDTPQGRPVLLTLRTNAPQADLDPMLFRYERDRPRDIHLRLQFASADEQ